MDTVVRSSRGCYPGDHVERFGDKPAVVDATTGRSVTYRELDMRSSRLARVLYDAGLRPGDHIALLSDNDPTAFEVYWAAMRSGLYITAINWHLAAAEMLYVVNDCGAKAVIAAAALADMAAQIATAQPDIAVRLAFGGDVDGYTRYEDALANASRDPLPAQPRGTDMLYSSGTTGRPKGIKPPLPQHQVDEPGDLYTELFGAAYGFDSHTIYLSPAPIYHAAPLRFGGVVQALGGAVVMMQRFDPEQALAAVENYGVTHSQWVPTMFVRMLKLSKEIRDRYDVTSMSTAIHAAAPCPVEVKNAMIDWWGPILHEYYSSTEGNGITFINSEQWLTHPGSVGRAGVGVLHVCDDEGNTLPPGRVGSVYFERERRPFEYHGDPDKTEKATHPVHPTWTTTGDLGYLDDDGYLYMSDRRGFLIISGGVNIYPQEVENVLTMHPHVTDVAVIGLPDHEMGESVHAVIIAAPDAPPHQQLVCELDEFLRTRIAGYKIPRTFSFVTDLPRTPTGKLAKTNLAQTISEQTLLRRHAKEAAR